MYTRFTPEEIASQEASAKRKRDLLFRGIQDISSSQTSISTPSKILFVGMISYGDIYYLWNFQNRAWICNAVNKKEAAKIHTVFQHTAEEVWADPDFIMSSGIEPYGIFDHPDTIDFWLAMPEYDRPQWAKDFFGI